MLLVSRIPVPAGRPREVADRLVDALGPPAGLVPGWAGRGVRAGRAGAQLPAGPWQAPADRAGVAAGQGRPRVPGWRRTWPGPGSGPPDLGGVPGRAGGSAERQQISPTAPGRNGGRWPITLDGAWIDQHRPGRLTPTVPDSRMHRRSTVEGLPCLLVRHNSWSRWHGSCRQSPRPGRAAGRHLSPEPSNRCSEQ